MGFVLRKASKTPLIYALEPRLLFDGDIGADVASAIVYRDGNNAETQSVAPENQRENVRAEATNKRNAVVIIDGALEDKQTLVDAAPEGAEIHVLDGQEDGFDQISALLKNHENIDELHIFGHGSAGEARLGTASLSLHTLTTHTDTLAVLKNALSHEGDILLYGCNIGAGEDGKVFVEELAELTAADIAASDDNTGISGDWDLEVVSGSIEAETISAHDYGYSLNPTGVTSMTNVQDRTQTYLNVKARPDISRSDRNGGRGFYDQTNQERFVIALEKSNITTSDTLYFDFGVASTNGFAVNSANPVNSYLVALNDDVGRRDSGNAQIVFDYEILGYYVDKYNTLGSGTMHHYDASANGSFSGQGDGDSRVTQISNSYFANSNWTYPTTTQINKRDSEGYFQRAFGTGSSSGADYVWTTNNYTLNFAAKNGNTSGTGDFIRVITRAAPPPNSEPTVSNATDVTGSVTELVNNHANENTATLTDTGSFTIADSDGDTVTVSRAFSSTTRGNNSAFGDLTATIANNTTTDGTGQINWTYSVDDSDLDALDAGENYTETWTITVNDGTDSVTQNVTVTINGAADNEAPTVDAITDTKTENDAQYTLDLLTDANAEDADSGDTVSMSGDVTLSFQNKEGNSATLPDGAASVSGSTLTIDPTVFNDLDDSENIVITASYNVTDGQETVANTATITINGANDAPVVTAITDSKTEDEAAFTTVLTDGQTDPDGDSLSVSGTPTITAVDGSSNSVTLPDGAATVSGNNLSVDPTLFNDLDDGESVVITVTYDVSDGTTTTQNTATITINGANDAPVVTAITDSKTEDEAAFTTVLTDGQTDPDGDSLSVSGTPTITAVDGSSNSVTLPDGAATVSGNNLSVDPTLFNDLDDGESVVITVTYDVSDGTTTTQNTATITINGANDAPTSADNTVTFNEDYTSAFSNRDFGFSDIDGDSRAHMTLSSLPDKGYLTLNGTVLDDAHLPATVDNIPTLRYVPPDNENGDSYTSFTFTVNDGTVDSASTYTMTINLSAINDAPVAADDSGSVVVGAAFSGYVLNNNNNMGGRDTDLEDDTLQITAFENADGDAGTVGDTGGLIGEYGTLVLNSDGSLTYNADQQAALDLNYGDAAVTDSFTYTVSDGTDTDTATITFSITAPDPGNEAPTVDAITDTKTENDAQYTLDLLTDANAEDADSGDTVSMSGDVTLSFQNKEGNSATLPDGAASVSGSTLTIDPTVFNDLDDSENIVITASYNVTDGQETVANTATITINGANDAPVVTAITDSKTEDEAAFTTVLTDGQTDPDGDSLSVSGTPTITAVDGSSNSVTLPDGAATVSGNNLSVDPTLFNDLDDGESVVITVTYDVSDGTTTTQNTATITINGANDAPVVTAITDSKTEDEAAFTTVLTDGQTDPDGDSPSVSGTPTITAVDGSSNSVTLPDGAATVSGNNLSVDPTLFNDLDDGESVVITVTYDVSDGTTTTQNTATITINGANDAPTVSALTDSKTKNDADYSFDLLQGASDVDGETLSVSGAPSYAYVDKGGNSASLPNGAVQHNGNSLTVSPGVFSDLNAGENVTITATYDVTDGTATVQNTATLTISGQNTQPEIIGDRGTPGTGVALVTTNEDTAYSFEANDFNYSDADSDELDHITIVSLPESGRLLLNNQPVTAGQEIAAGDIGNLSFVPDANENGQEYASFVYSVNDGFTDSANGMMTVQVDAVNDAPTSANGNLALQGDDEVSLARTDFTFADIDGDALDHITIVSLPTNGDLTFRGQPVQVGDDIPANRIEQLSYKPDDGASGANYDSFQFSVNDGIVDSAATYEMNIGVNAAPQAQADSITFAEDIVGGFSGTLQGSDAEGNSLSYEITQQPENGRVVLSGNGPNYVFIPTPHYYGPDEFEFIVSDGQQSSAPAKVDVTITQVNDRPVVRYEIDDVNLMAEQKLRMQIPNFFGEIDAFDPQTRGFERDLAKLFSRGKFPQSSQLDPLPIEGELQFNVVGLPEGLSFNGTHIVGSTLQSGTHPITVIATDGLGATRETSFRLNVAMPTIDEIVEPTVDEPVERETEPDEKEKTDLADHDLPPMLKVNPKRDGTVPIREMITPDSSSNNIKVDSGGIGDSAGLADDGWMKGPVSSEQDVSGNIRVVDLKVEGDEIAVQITDEAVDRAERFKGEMADGSALPDWVKVDPTTGLTTAEPPSGAAAIEMRVIAEDEAGNARAIDLVLNPESLKGEGGNETTREERREARQERREARQAAREARIEARETRQAERQAARILREVSRSDVSVNVMDDGRVQFSDALTAVGEGAIKLMRMVADTQAVTIEITDEAQGEATRYEVRQKDGTAAPDWVRVDVQTGELIIAAPDNAANIELTLVAVDGSEQRSIDLELNLEEMREQVEDEEDKAIDNPEGDDTINDVDASETGPVGAFMPLDTQINAALAKNSYGRDIQFAFSNRG